MKGKTNLVNWFEIPVEDLDRAQTFYEQILGSPMTRNGAGAMQMAMFSMEDGAPGTAGALVLADGYNPSCGGPVVYFTVDDIPSTLEKVVACCGEELAPKTPIGQYGFIAHFLDSEGNHVALHSMK